MIDDRRMSVSCESLLGREEMDGWFVLSVDWDFWPAREENGACQTTCCLMNDVSRNRPSRSARLVFYPVG